MKKAIAFVLTVLVVCFHPTSALADTQGFVWGSLGAFIPLLLIWLISLIAFLIIYNKGHNKENKVVWLTFYTYVSLPLGILILIPSIIQIFIGSLGTGANPAFAAILAVFFCFILYGLHKRRMWGWIGNWIILGMPISFVLLDLFNLDNNFPAHIGGVLGKLIVGTILFLPNYIYFKKRRFLFDHSIPIIRADIVVPKETKDDHVEHSNKSVEKENADIISERKEAKLGKTEPMGENAKRQNEQFPYEAELQRRVFAQLLKEEKDEATMLQAKVICDGDIERIETSYYKLRHQQMLESGDIEDLKRKILTEKRQQEEKRKNPFFGKS